jgi:hypothetical protein
MNRGVGADLMCRLCWLLAADLHPIQLMPSPCLHASPRRRRCIQASFRSLAAVRITSTRRSEKIYQEQKI